MKQIVKNYISQLRIVGGKSQLTIGMYLNGIKNASNKMTDEEVQYGLKYYERISN